MRPLCALAAALALTIACGGGNTPTSPTPLPFSPAAFGTAEFLSRGRFSATIDGQAWRGAPIVSFSGFAAGERFTVFSSPSPGADGLSVSGPLAVGTYPATMAPDFFSSAIFILTRLPITWSVNPFDPAGSGTLTVTVASRTRVAGTFAFTGVPGVNAAGATPRVVTNGTFDVSQ